MRIAVPRCFADASLNRIGDCTVAQISRDDGTKVYLDGDNWLLLRFSGTEPVLRLVVEADSPQKAGELMTWLKESVAATAKAPPGPAGSRHESQG